MKIISDTIGRKRKIQYCILILALFLAFYYCRNIEWNGNTQLHTILEVIATTLAFMLGSVALIHYHSNKNNTILFIGTGFLGTAFLDGYHAVVTSTFFDTHFPSPPPSLNPWSWNASRLFLSVLLFISWLVWEIERKSDEPWKINEKVVYFLTSVLTLVVFGFFAFYPLPRAYYPEFAIPRPEEYISALFFLLAFIGYISKGRWKRDNFEHWLNICLIISFMSQAMFMSFSLRLYDFMFDAAHLLKQLSYIAVMIGLFINMYLLFRQAEVSREQLVLINKGLNDEIAERVKIERRLITEVEERKRADEKLRKTQLQLLQAEKMKVIGRLASGVAHEVKNPLAIIQAGIDLMNEKVQGNMKATLGDIENAVDRANTVVKGLLDFASVSELERESVKIDDVIDSVLMLLKHSFTKHKIDVTKKIAKNIPKIKLDQNKIEQALVNLILNAVRAMPNGGEIKINVFEDRIGEDEVNAGLRRTDHFKQGDRVLFIEILDNGSGIPEENIEKIFDPFFTTSKSKEGSGLGLSIVSNIIDLHRGDVKLENIKDEGVKATIALKFD